MNKIKVIDLLNMISKGEEVPKAIRVRGVFHPDWDENNKPIDVEDMTIWYLDDSYFNYDYYSIDKFGEGKNMFQTYLINRILNNEVEILEEEKKIPEKIPLSSYHNSTDDIKEKVLINKINGIIDYLDYLKSKGE